MFPPGLVDHLTFVRLCVARDFLAANCFRRVTLAQAADKAGFSPFHFQRLFSRTFGESPHDFLTRLRLDEARKRLSSGSTVTEICFDLGYESLGTFSSMFARQVGVSPSEFRRVYSTPGLWALKCAPACYRAPKPLLRG